MLVEFAELTGVPVIPTLMGWGAIPDDHPLSAGGLGCHRTRLSKRLLGEADVVLGLGLPLLGYAAVFQNVWFVPFGLVLVLFGLFGWVQEPATE